MPSRAANGIEIIRRTRSNNIVNIRVRRLKRRRLTYRHTRNMRRPRHIINMNSLGIPIIRAIHAKVRVRHITTFLGVNGERLQLRPLNVLVKRTKNVIHQRQVM